MSESSTPSAPASTLEKGDAIVIDGRPCQITDVSSSPQKWHFVARDIFSEIIFETTVAQDASVEIPNLFETTYYFAYIDDDFLHLIKPDGTEKNDVKCPDGEIGDRIRYYEEAGRDMEITVLTASSGEEAAIAVKL